MPTTDSMPPLISTSATGPAGIMHLPRLWLKIRLHAAGRLAEGYRHGEGGFDDALCEHFGVDRPAFVTYVETERPDYLAAERWFTSHANNHTPEKIAAFNAHVTKASFSDPARSKLFRDRVGHPDETLTRVIPLNDLDDWYEIHEMLS